MITAEELKKLVDGHASRQSEIARQAAYVKGKNPAILAPYPKEEPDNRIPVAFARRAVNLVVGYMAKEGNITYSGDGFDDRLKKIFDSNDEGLLTMELLKTALTHGQAFELHWTESSEDQFAQIPIDQCIPIYDKTIRPVMIGFARCWKEENDWYADVYDNKNIQRFERKQNAGAWGPKESIAHGYGRVPIVGFQIDECKGNLFDHVTAMIDQYDKIMSEDYANELARFASSYMGMAGRLSDEIDEITGESEIDKIKRNKIFQDLGEARAVTDSIAFITKNINDTFINSAADRFERLIYAMLSIIDPDNDQFSGQSISGDSRKWKLIGFEYLCAGIATYFSIGLQDRIALIKGLNNNLSAKVVNAVRSFWGRRKANTDVTIDWKRNLPDDLKTISEIVSGLGGINLTDETKLRLFPDTLIPDKAKELKEIQQSTGTDIFAAGEPGIPATGAGGANVQATALNGAQVTALQGLAQSVADGQLPYETALEVVLVAFPTISREEAIKMLKPADDFEPKKEEPIITAFGANKGAQDGMQGNQEKGRKTQGQMMDEEIP